jgi:hypothetical protein
VASVICSVPKPSDVEVRRVPKTAVRDARGVAGSSSTEGAHSKRE